MYLYLFIFTIYLYARRILIFNFSIDFSNLRIDVLSPSAVQVVHDDEKGSVLKVEEFFPFKNSSKS